MKRRTLISLLVTLALVILVIVVAYQARQGRSTATTIGAALPLTGDLAKFGTSFRRGIELAVGSEKPSVQVVYEDDQGNPATAATVFQKLIAVDHAPLVIGGAISSAASAMAPIADRNKVVLLSPAATAPSLSSFRFFFRVQPSDLFEGSLMANYLSNKLELHKVAVVYVNNDWGKGLHDAFASAYSAVGGEITSAVPFERQNTDFRTIIARLKQNDSGDVYLLGYLDELLAFLTQATELGLESRYFGAFSMYDPAILANIPAKTLEGAILTVPLFDPESSEPRVQKFSEEYQARYGETPDQLAAHAYDCGRLAVAAITAGYDSGSEIAQYFETMGTFRGVTGDMKFEGGDVVKAYRIFTVHDGAYQYVTTLEP